MKLIFSLLLIILFVISLFSYFLCFIELNDFLSIAVLFITAWAIGMQSFATEKMARYQVIPAIDVNMVYDKNVGKTYFWFSNESNLPGFVFLEYKKNKEKRKTAYHPLRIPPKRRMRTATTFEFSPIVGDDVMLYVSIKPSLDKSNIKFEFEKKYIFSDDNKWNELSWSFPDPSFPMI